MDVFYYKCPKCNSRVVDPNEDHTLMVCLTCGFAWGKELNHPTIHVDYRKARFAAFDVIAGGILIIFIILACLCGSIATSYPL